MNNFEEDMKDAFPMVYRPTQCLFCLGDESLPYHHRVYEYAKANKMMNEVGRHLRRFAPEDQVPCPHPRCKAVGLGLPGVMLHLTCCLQSECRSRINDGSCRHR